jgi:3D (Asp-Asp-Asp) domain-containing protein
MKIPITKRLTATSLGLSLAMVICYADKAYSRAPQPNLNGRYIATAYSQTGPTKSGVYTHDHVIAADPTILPVGSRIKVSHAGRYSGEYVVADTGEKIVGRKLDIYIPNTKECMRFGKRRVKVTVVEFGDGTHEGTKQADEAVKQDVKQDVSKGVVGNAATERDWVKQGAPVAAAVGATAGSTAPRTRKPAPPATSEGTGNPSTTSGPPR